MKRSNEERILNSKLKKVNAQLDSLKEKYGDPVKMGGNVEEVYVQLNAEKFAISEKLDFLKKKCSVLKDRCIH